MKYAQANDKIGMYSWQDIKSHDHIMLWWNVLLTGHKSTAKFYSGMKCTLDRTQKQRHISGRDEMYCGQEHFRQGWNVLWTGTLQAGMKCTVDRNISGRDEMYCGLERFRQGWNVLWTGNLGKEIFCAVIKSIPDRTQGQSISYWYLLYSR